MYRTFRRTAALFAMVRGECTHDGRIQNSHRRSLPLVDGPTLRIVEDEINHRCGTSATKPSSLHPHRVENRVGPVRGAFPLAAGVARAR